MTDFHPSGGVGGKAAPGGAPEGAGGLQVCVVPGSGARDLPRASPFADDDGSADPNLADALAGFAAGSQDLSDVVARLSESRVLIPILAQLDVAGRTKDGHVVEKEASAGVVALEAPDGRRVLPIFSSVATMALWHPQARPVPADAARAALSAVSEGWALLVLDPAGPMSVLVPRPAVWAIAQGRPWLPAVVDGVIDPAVAASIIASVGPIPSVGRVSVEPGRSKEIAVVLGIDEGLTRAELDVVLAQVNAALGADSLVSERVDSLELRVGRA